MTEAAGHVVSACGQRKIPADGVIHGMARAGDCWASPFLEISVYAMWLMWRSEERAAYIFGMVAGFCATRALSDPPTRPAHVVMGRLCGSFPNIAKSFLRSKTSLGEGGGGGDEILDHKSKHILSAAPRLGQTPSQTTPKSLEHYQPRHFLSVCHAPSADFDLIWRMIGQVCQKHSKDSPRDILYGLVMRQPRISTEDVQQMTFVVKTWPNGVNSGPNLGRELGQLWTILSERWHDLSQIWSNSALGA